MLGAPERAMRVVVLRQLGDAGAERDSVHSIGMACGVKGAEQRLRVISCRSRQDERKLARPETMNGSVAGAVRELLRHLAQSGVRRLAVDTLGELLEPFEADNEHGERLTVTTRVRDLT
jgi:hypothetical protein